MDTSQITGDIPSLLAKETVALPATTSTSTGTHMGGPGGDHHCKIFMLWNWNTIDSCFISSKWHITSPGMFAGSCLGVIVLAMFLEFVRRVSKEYDIYLVHNHFRAIPTEGDAPVLGSQSLAKAAKPTTILQAVANFMRSRPSIYEQSIRALLHVVQFAVAYFLMLLAMYYNGYIIICILIGSYLGLFVFHWETMNTIRNAPSARLDPSGCCG